MVMFKKKKQSIYDEYDEYDEYDDDDDYDDDYEELKEDLISQRKKNRTDLGVKKQEQQAQKEQLAVIDHLKKENQLFGKELERQKVTTERLKMEVENKQQEIDQLTMRLTTSSKTKERMQTLESQLIEMEHFKRTLETELSEEKEKNNMYMKQMQQYDAMKNQIAEVLMDAKEKARQIIDQASLEADKTVNLARIETEKVVSEAAVELKMINQEAANYHNRIARLQGETKILMEELLDKSSRLAEQSLD